MLFLMQHRRCGRNFLTFRRNLLYSRRNISNFIVYFIGFLLQFIRNTHDFYYLVPDIVFTVFGGSNSKLVWLAIPTISSEACPKSASLLSTLPTLSFYSVAVLKIKRASSLICSILLAFSPLQWIPLIMLSVI